MSYFENMCAQTGYTPITTFWKDFSIAEIFDIDAIEDMYKRYFDEWKDSVKEFTELVMVLNWKCWEWHYKNKAIMSEYYGQLYYDAYDFGIEHFKGEDLSYFWRTLD